MSIHFVCPHCGVATDTDDKFAGQTGPCANCGQSITIPDPDGELLQPQTHTARAVVIAAVVVLLMGGLIAWAVLTLSPTASQTGMAQRSACAGNLRQIAMAVHAYEAAHGCFPPAYVADQHGKPMYSWRALILPYLDNDLADRFHFDEPWDSPKNRMVSDLTIGLFQCPAQPKAQPATTNYMMVVGPHTISNGPDSVRLANITDGPADTIMIVEVADSDVHWAEPRDLRFDRLKFSINERRGISSHHPGGANAAFCAEHSEESDDLVRFLKDSTNPYLVQAMLTVDVGEPEKPETTEKTRKAKQ